MMEALMNLGLSVVCSENIDQPFGLLVVLAGGSFKYVAVFVYVAKSFSDLHKPDVLIAGDVRAVNSGAAALAVIAFAVPAVEGEAYPLVRPLKMCFKLRPGYGRAVFFKAEGRSHLIKVVHCLFILLAAVSIGNKPLSRLVDKKKRRLRFIKSRRVRIGA